MKTPIEIFVTANTSELTENKIFVDVQPVDDWQNWSYKIYMEDAMSPFFQIYQQGEKSHFKTYRSALADAFDYLEKAGIIEITELPF